MKAVLPLVFFLLLAVAAQARIGETLAQCIHRYGQPVTNGKVLDQGQVTYFKKDAYVVGVTFFEGAADYLIFFKEKGEFGLREKLSDNEVELLMAANAGGKTWKKRDVISMNTEWMTEDGTLCAGWTADKSTLIIFTKDNMYRSAAAKAAREARALEGF